MEDERKVFIVRCKSGLKEGRYETAVEENGQLKVIDDAQGWGYRSRDSAMAAYRYKEAWKKKQREGRKEADDMEIDRRIGEIEEELEAVGRRYMALEQELQNLRKKKKETDVAAVAEAYMKSHRTAEEVIRFLQS